MLTFFGLKSRELLLAVMILLLSIASMHDSLYCFTVYSTLLSIYCTSIVFYHYGTHIYVDAVIK